MVYEGYEERRARILRITRRLILRMGYTKVTVQDVADASGVGKGTIYLHWRGKDEIVHELLRRELNTTFRNYAERLREHVDLVRFSRTSHDFFMCTLSNPLLRAYNCGDRAVLGHLAMEPHGPDPLGVSLYGVLTHDEHIGVLRRHGLVIDDAGSSGARLALGAVIDGFLKMGTASATQDHLSVVARLFATVVRRSFEPAVMPETWILERAHAQLVAVHGCSETVAAS